MEGAHLMAKVNCRDGKIREKRDDEMRGVTNDGRGPFCVPTLLCGRCFLDHAILFRYILFGGIVFNKRRVLYSGYLEASWVIFLRVLRGTDGCVRAREYC